METSPVHLERRVSRDPACQSKDPAARRACDPRIVTCLSCQATPQYAVAVRRYAMVAARDAARKAARQRAGLSERA